VFVKAARNIDARKARQERLLVSCESEDEIMIVVFLAYPTAV
jgi:hypothetical protein